MGGRYLEEKRGIFSIFQTLKFKTFSNFTEKCCGFCQLYFLLEIMGVSKSDCKSKNAFQKLFTIGKRLC